MAVNGMDFHPAFQPCPFGNAALSHLANHWSDGGNANNTQHPVSENREQKIGNRPGSRNGDALGRRFRGKRLLTQLFRYRPFPLIQHFHVPPQGDGRYRIFGSVTVIPRKQRLAEPHGKTKHLHTESACHPEMAVFVQRYQNSEGKRQCQYGLNDLHRRSGLWLNERPVRPRDVRQPAG